MFVLIKSKTSLNSVTWGQNLDHLVILKKYLVGTLVAAFSSSVDLKISPNVCLDETSEKFEFVSPVELNIFWVL